MKNQKVKRCPWCGSETEKLGLRTQMIKKCLKCGQEYTYGDGGFGDSNVKKYIRISLLVLSICCLFFSVFSKIFFIIMLFGFVLSYIIGIEDLNYERYNDKEKFKYKKYVSEIRFTMHISKKEIKSLLSNDSIIPICFVDNDKIPVSNDICVLVESAKENTDEINECIFSFYRYLQ